MHHQITGVMTAEESFLGEVLREVNAFTGEMKKFHDLKVTDFVPVEDYENDYWWKTYAVVRGRQKVYVKATAPISYYAIQEFGDKLIKACGHVELWQTLLDDERPGEVALELQPTDDGKDIQLTFTFFQKTLTLTK